MSDPGVPLRSAHPAGDSAPERAGEANETTGDLRIRTPGLSDEEVAAITSVVTAAIEAQRAANEDGRESAEAANARRWRHSVGPLAGAAGFIRTP